MLERRNRTLATIYHRNLQYSEGDAHWGGELADDDDDDDDVLEDLYMVTEERQTFYQEPPNFREVSFIQSHSASFYSS